MKKRVILLIFVIVLIITSNGCTFSQKGSTINGFAQRMNEYNESYNMTADGYIFDSSERSFSKFIKFGEEEILLKFFTDEKNRTDTFHIVFTTGGTENNSNIKNFIEHCISAFYENDEETEKILNEIDFHNTIIHIQKGTKNAEADNIKMEIDITELGTVVSLYKYFN